jgi:hypothetical protein
MGCHTCFGRFLFLNKGAALVVFEAMFGKLEEFKLVMSLNTSGDESSTNDILQNFQYFEI